MMTDLYPIRFEPVYKNYIWGGNRISRLYNRPNAPERCAESWEIADRQDGMSIVSNGPLKGKSLRELMLSYRHEMCGKSSEQYSFPLLIKLIDAEKRLSVQVHPNDFNAHICCGEPKTELWYVLKAESGAKIAAGLAEGTDEKSLRLALKNKNLQNIISLIPVKSGQAVYIPGGLVHSIGEGLLLLEIQQNSNTTYRLYDWDRTEQAGQPRELHIEKAIKAIEWNYSQPPVIEPVLISQEKGCSLWSILESPYFIVKKIDLSKSKEMFKDSASWQALFIVSGEVAVSGNGVSETCRPGSCILIPAVLDKYLIIPAEKSEIIITCPAQPDRLSSTSSASLSEA